MAANGQPATAETLPEITARLARETEEAYDRCRFSALSKDYFTRFSRDPSARPAEGEVLVDERWRIALSADEPVLFSRPSIDVLFESAADTYGANLLAIVLTGANEDGARGAAQIEARGGSVLVEDPATAYAAAMPAAALARCFAARALSLDAIADHLLRVTAR